MHFCLQTLLCKRYYFTRHVCKIVNVKSCSPLGTDCSGQNLLDMSGKRGKKSDSEVKRARKNRPKVTSSRQQAENQHKTFSAHAQLLLHLLLNNFYVYIMSQSRQQCHLSTIVSQFMEAFFVRNLFICIHWEKYPIGSNLHQNQENVFPRV